MDYLHNIENSKIFLSKLLNGIKLYDDLYSTEFYSTNSLISYESLVKININKKALQADLFFGNITRYLLNDEESKEIHPAKACAGISYEKYSVLFSQADSEHSKLDDFRLRLKTNMSLFKSKDWDEIKGAVEEKFKVIVKDLSTFELNLDYYYTKINHGYWECILKAMLDPKEHTGIRENINELEMHEAYFSCLFTEKLTRDIVNSVTLSPIDNVMKFDPTLNFAINFSAGNIDIKTILENHENEMTRMSAVSALAYFETLFPVQPIELYDGSMTKSLCQGEYLNEFIKKASSGAEAILFIVPSHLRNISLVNVDCETHVLTIPRFNVHQMWPAISFGCLGVLYDLLLKYDNIKIFSQCAVYSAMLTFLVKELKDRKFSGMGKTLHYFDLGRVLDVADLEGCAWQPWTKSIQNDKSFLNPFTLGA